MLYQSKFVDKVGTRTTRSYFCGINSKFSGRAAANAFSSP